MTDVMHFVQHNTVDVIARQMQRDVEEIAKLKQDRDELLAALKSYQRAGYGNSTDFMMQGEAYDLSVAAIEKVEKQLAQNADLL